MDNLPTEQSDLDKINAEPATGSFGETTPQTQFQPPQTQAPTTQPQPTAPKKNHKKRNIIIIAIVILILLIGTAAALWFFSRPKQTSTQTSTPPPTPVKPIDDAQGIVGKLNTALTDKKSTDYQGTQIQFTTPTTTPPATSPSYKVGGADYYVTTAQAYGLTISKLGDTSDVSSASAVDTTFTQAIIGQLTTTFNKNNYHQIDSTATSSEFQSSSVICDISLSNSYPVSVTCANKDAYTKVSSDLKPFVTAYRATNPGDTSDSVFSTATIQSSTNTSYQKATINISSRQGIGGAALLFYRHNSDAWQFFKGTQNILSCTDYATADLKAAFAGETCATATGESTVGASTTGSSSTNSNSSSTTNGGTTPSTGTTPPAPAQ